MILTRNVGNDPPSRPPRFARDVFLQSHRPDRFFAPTNLYLILMNQKSTPERLKQVAQARVFKIVVQTAKTLRGCLSCFAALCGRNPAE